MMPSPSYADDAQLKQMAGGGLPSAMNEMEMRDALRRGTQVNPNPPVSAPKGKMTSQEMIDDFVNRVRMNNERARNSLVPMGTPMQPPPQQAPQPPQGPPGFQTGGVYRGPSNPDWINRESYTNPEGFVSVPPKEDDFVKWLNERTSTKPQMTDDEAANWLNQRTQISPQDYAGMYADFGGSGSEKASVDMRGIGDLQMPPERASPGYKGFKVIDPMEAGNEAVKAGQGQIDNLLSPFQELKEGYGKDMKQRERNKIFDALIQGGIAMMQGGGPSFDPASGNFMKILGDGAQQYANSLLGSEDRISQLREKIAMASGKSAELGFNASNILKTQGMEAANQKNSLAAQDSYQRMLHDNNVMDYVLGRDQMGIQVQIANMDARAKIMAAEIGGAGKGSEALMDIFKEGVKAYSANFNPETDAQMGSEDKAKTVIKAANDMKQVLASGMQMILGMDMPKASALAEQLTNKLVTSEDDTRVKGASGKRNPSFSYPDAPRPPRGAGIDENGIMTLDASHMFVPGTYNGR